MFVDDLILLGNTNRVELWAFSNILSIYEAASGLKLNREKTTLFTNLDHTSHINHSPVGSTFSNANYQRTLSVWEIPNLKSKPKKEHWSTI